MLGRTLAFVACVIGFAVIVVPRGDVSTGADEWGAAPVAPAPGAPASAQNDWNAGDYTLVREGDGHFYAAASIDGASVRMMVDTGASVIALTGEDASAAGLYWDDAEVQPIGRGASGTVYGVPARLDEVEIGGMVRRNVAAIIVPEGLDVSLLGQSFLGQIGTVEIRGDTLVMGGE